MDNNGEEDNYTPCHKVLLQSLEFKMIALLILVDHILVRMPNSLTMIIPLRKLTI